MHFLAAALWATAASAHFTLDYPTTIGFSDDNEDTGPCGGFTLDFSSDNITEFHVDGENIAVDLFHTQANYLFRATLDESASSGWTQLFPVVQQSGIGYFCEPSVPAPSSWVGENGVLSVVLDGPDGILYQCASVKFVSGTGTTQSTCINTSTISVAFTDDSTLTALLSNSTSNSSSTVSSTASSTSTTASSTASSNASTITPGFFAIIAAFLGFMML